MAEKDRVKTLFINKESRVNSELFNKVRLSLGLSRWQISQDLEMAPNTVRRVFQKGSDPRPDTVRVIGEYLGIPSDDWYVPREETETSERSPSQ
jgi:ribosome-binding protein aMBF1 (putative translation factor)